MSRALLEPIAVCWLDLQIRILLHLTKQCIGGHSVTSQLASISIQQLPRKLLTWETENGNRGPWPASVILTGLDWIGWGVSLLDVFCWHAVWLSSLEIGWTDLVHPFWLRLVRLGIYEQKLQTTTTLRCKHKQRAWKRDVPVCRNTAWDRTPFNGLPENRKSPQITANQHNVILKPPHITPGKPQITAYHRRSA